jgi:peptidoglycan/xylan/chitin deacetylase (PgdA/CDA1 family)
MFGDRPDLKSALRRGYLSALSRLNRRAVVRGPDRPAVALTFDDGPSRRWTPAILEALDRAGARATFFMIGEHVERRPEIARQVVEGGHEPAAHLFTHDRAVADDDALFDEELERAIAVIERTTGRRPAFLRLPFAYAGRQQPRRIEAAHGVRTVHWSFSSLDSRRGADQVRARVARWLFPGAIVLMHDGVGGHSSHAQTRDATVAALPAVLDHCRRAGLAPVTLSELLGD